MKYRDVFTALLLISFSLLMGCARPNYESASGGTGANTVSVTRTCGGVNVLCPLAFQKLDACASIHYQSLPQVGKESSGILYFSKPLPPELTIQARLWMPAHQHYSARPLFQRLDDSRFAIRRLRFFMIGRWELSLQLLKENQVIDETILPICL